MEEIADLRENITDWSVALLFFSNYRSSHRRWSVKKDAFRNFAKFTGKHLCQSHFFNKVASLSPATLLKRDSGQGVFL